MMDFGCESGMLASKWIWLFGTETDSKENVLEWKVGDHDEKIMRPLKRNASRGSELGVVNPSRKIQENNVKTRTLTLDELTKKTLL